MMFLLALLFLLVCYAYYKHSRQRLEALAAKIPGPPAWPLVGNALEFMGSTQDVLNTISELLGIYSTPVSFWLGSRLYVAISHPDDVQAVLTSPHALEKDPAYRVMEAWLGHGLFTAPVSRWRVHRKLIAPSFNPRILERFLDVFNAQAQVLVHRLSQIKECDIFQYVNACSLDTICETALGGQQMLSKNSEYIRSSERLSQIVSTRIFKAWLHPDWIFHLTNIGREFVRELKRARDMAQKVIEQRRQEPEYNENDGSKKIFIDLLLEQNLSDQEVLDEVTTMLVAGNDTTATVTSFVLLALAIQQNAQDRVQEELRNIFGSDMRPATSKDLREMVFLEKCIKETLRMFPVAPMLARRVTEDIKLATSGLVLPAGCSVAICIQHMHRQPDMFPQPELFLPERFSGEDKRHPYSFLPFSAGPRNCVGLRYAMLLVKVMTSTVLRHYSLSSPIQSFKNLKLTLDILLKPVQGYPVLLKPLNK